MQEAQNKVAAQRTDFSVGVEGNSNKAFQARPLITFGEEKTPQHRMRETSQNIGAVETKQAYDYTSERRNAHKQKVYSVNIPFSKYAVASKPGSAQGAPPSAEEA